MKHREVRAPLMLARAGLALLILLAAFVPAASAACTTQEVLHVGPPVDVTLAVTKCDGQAQYGYSGDGVGTQNACTPEGVPSVRVLGQQVPGTGDARVCVPVTGPKPPGGGGDFEAVLICTPGCVFVGADPDLALCYAYSVGRVADDGFYCYLSS